MKKKEEKNQRRTKRTFRRRFPPSQPNRIYLHYTPEEEIKQRAKKGGKR